MKTCLRGHNQIDFCEGKEKKIKRDKGENYNKWQVNIHKLVRKTNCIKEKNS